jgi:NAD(P)-dependent dehydrogenase (short-subunit alcohol dehydrogenase family)
MARYLIIGASSGIGEALAKMLLDEGHEVIGTGNRKMPSLRGIRAYPYNVTAEEADTSFIPEVLDGLVYCPGSIVLKPFNRISAQDFMKDMQLQLMGAVQILQKAQNALMKGSNPSVILFSSLAATQGLKFHTMVSASKAAIEGFARALAAEWAPTVRVNVIAPSLTDTPLASVLLNSPEKRTANASRHPLKKIGDAEDLAGMAKFLLSEQAKWISGQVMHVDGGLSRLQA